MDEYFSEITDAAAEMAKDNEAEYHLCSQGTLAALMNAFGIHNPDVLRSSTAFAGGCVRRGNICGALSGALMFLGLLAGRDDLEMKDQAIRGMGYMEDLFRKFEERYGSVICRDIQQKLYGRVFDLTNEEERDELHEIMMDAEEGCPDVCKTAARFAAEVAIEILEAGHPFANSIVRI
ncbi:MAG: C-GCAxxG-C-C family protein [Thermovirgaceae bacterium]